MLNLQTTIGTALIDVSLICYLTPPFLEAVDQCVSSGCEHLLNNSPFLFVNILAKCKCDDGRIACRTRALLLLFLILVLALALALAPRGNFQPMAIPEHALDQATGAESSFDVPYQRRALRGSGCSRQLQGDGSNNKTGHCTTA